MAGLQQNGTPTLRLSYEQLRKTLGHFEYFKYWTDEQIRECCILARVEQFAPQQTILLDREPPCAHLVLSGQCMLLQCLQMLRVTVGSRATFQLVVLPETPLVEVRDESPDELVRWHETFRQRSDAFDEVPGSEPDYEPNHAVSFLRTPPPQEQQIVHHFLDVGTLRSGAVFGIGERFQHRRVVARTRTQCLLIPRRWLLLKHQNIGNTWHRLRMYLDESIPSRHELFQRFLRNRAWERYRRRLVREAPKRPSHTRPADVPVMCRIAQSQALPVLVKQSPSSGPC
ncbi:uncharacterized protein LOC131213440 [Anopheles bellator]|uniref:uncharacterized protein LOC131213440 n=1 Tax=Anopheles bellator TaxID=139047 RepID=UPI002649BB29|nr:uncharacterized protein LOC131213440 [Anopheles bellator]